MSNLLKDATATLNELLRMHELNQELLETLTVTMLWIKNYTEKHNIPIPKKENLSSLINKAQSLINEISSDSTPFLQHRFRTPEDSTEPIKPCGCSEKEYGDSQNHYNV